MSMFEFVTDQTRFLEYFLYYKSKLIKKFTFCIFFHILVLTLVSTYYLHYFSFLALQYFWSNVPKLMKKVTFYILKYLSFKVLIILSTYSFKCISLLFFLILSTYHFRYLLFLSTSKFPISRTKIVHEILIL